MTEVGEKVIFKPPELKVAGSIPALRTKKISGLQAKVCDPLFSLVPYCYPFGAFLGAVFTVSGRAK